MSLPGKHRKFFLEEVVVVKEMQEVTYLIFIIGPETITFQN